MLNSRDLNDVVKINKNAVEKQVFLAVFFSKKVLTKVEESDIIQKLSARAAVRSLKIEQ